MTLLLKKASIVPMDNKKRLLEECATTVAQLFEECGSIELSSSGMKSLPVRT